MTGVSDWRTKEGSHGKLADPKRAHITFVSVLENIYEGTTCEDDATLVVSLKQPSAAVLTMLAGAHAVMMQDGIAERFDRKDPKLRGR